LQAETGYVTVFARGTFEHSIRAEIAPRVGELVINKVSTSAFNSTGLDEILRRLGVANLILTGVTTEACVDSTARDAADRGYCCVMVEDGCAAWDRVTQESTLRTFARCFGMVMKTSEVMEALFPHTRT
jgi:nicotinamidase-related amidase